MKNSPARRILRIPLFPGFDVAASKVWQAAALIRNWHQCRARVPQAVMKVLTALPGEIRSFFSFAGFDGGLRS